MATIVAMAISLAYPIWLLSYLTASPYNNVSESNPALGIRLYLSVNSTSLKHGDTIAVEISEYNVSPFPNEVRAASDWPLGDLSLGVCGTRNLPIGFAIFHGYYSKDNISVGRPLKLFELSAHGCIGIYLSSYAFDPMSNLASFNRAYFVASCTPNLCIKLPIEHRAQVAGSLGEPISTWGQGTFYPFSPGVYTVAGGDEWGDLLLLNFTVS